MGQQYRTDAQMTEQRDGFVTGSFDLVEFALTAVAVFLKQFIERPGHPVIEFDDIAGAADPALAPVHIVRQQRIAPQPFRHDVPGAAAGPF